MSRCWLYMYMHFSNDTPCRVYASPDGSAVWGVVVSTRWWLLVDHCVLRNWDRILVRAVKGLISRAGMVSICPLLWQRDVKLQQTIQGVSVGYISGHSCCAGMIGILDVTWMIVASSLLIWLKLASYIYIDLCFVASFWGGVLDKYEIFSETFNINNTMFYGMQFYLPDITPR